MDINGFKDLEKSGGLVSDADLHNKIEEVVEEEEIEDVEQEITEDVEEVDDLPALSDKEKTAFDKRLERERGKLEEKLRKEIEEQSEQKYSKHRAAIEAIGGDPDKIIEAAKESALKREADRLGDDNGWSEDDKRYYIEQEKQKQELKELRVQRQIDKLKNDPDYAGIDSMEKEILTKIDKSGGQLTVDEAYWALGGAKKAAQIKLEATMREQERRKQQPRAVLTDAATSTTSEKPLPSDVLKAASRLGIPTSAAAEMMKGESPQTLDEYKKRYVK